MKKCMRNINYLYILLLSGIFTIFIGISKGESIATLIGKPSIYAETWIVSEELITACIATIILTGSIIVLFSSIFIVTEYIKKE